MIRFLTPLFAVLLLAAHVAPAADARQLILRWHGQSFFDLETSQGTRIVFDPHAIEAYGRTMVKADLVLISHFHDDHTQTGILRESEKAKVIRGLKVDNKKLDWDLVDEKVR